MSRTLPGNMVVDNRPGAVGTIGHASVARARPDGTTLLLGVNSTYAMSRHLNLELVECKALRSGSVFVKYRVKR